MFKWAQLYCAAISCNPSLVRFLAEQSHTTQAPKVEYAHTHTPYSAEWIAPNEINRHKTKAELQKRETKKRSVDTQQRHERIGKRMEWKRKRETNKNVLNAGIQWNGLCLHFRNKYYDDILCGDTWIGARKKVYLSVLCSNAHDNTAKAALFCLAHSSRPTGSFAVYLSDGDLVGLLLYISDMSIDLFGGILWCRGGLWAITSCVMAMTKMICLYMIRKNQFTNII